MWFFRSGDLKGLAIIIRWWCKKGGKAERSVRLECSKLNRELLPAHADGEIVQRCAVLAYHAQRDLQPGQIAGRLENSDTHWLTVCVQQK